MLRLFSNIRKSLINEGKTSRYVRYAVGEVLLIMVGILLALQVQNWNEGRKNKSLEKHYLGRIVEDLKRDVADILGTRRNSFRKVLVGNNVLKKLGAGDFLGQMESNGNYDNLLVELAEFTATTDLPLEPKSGLWLGLLSTHAEIDLASYTYNELIATGRFEIISDSSLREKISDYYQSAQASYSVTRHISNTVQKFNNVRLEYNLSILSDVTLDEFLNRHEDVDPFITATQDLIWGHLTSLGPFHYGVRAQAEALVNELEDYLETLD